MLTFHFIYFCTLLYDTALYCTVQSCTGLYSSSSYSVPCFFIYLLILQIQVLFYRSMLFPILIVMDVDISVHRFFLPDIICSTYDLCMLYQQIIDIIIVYIIIVYECLTAMSPQSLHNFNKIFLIQCNQC